MKIYLLATSVAYFWKFKFYCFIVIVVFLTAGAVSVIEGERELC
jgi:hypothetical protein